MSIINAEICLIEASRVLRGRGKSSDQEKQDAEIIYQNALNELSLEVSSKEKKLLEQELRSE